MENRINKHSYYEIAVSDLEYLGPSMEIIDAYGNYNILLRACQEVVEKLLKYIINEVIIDSESSSLLKTHKLIRLYNKIKDNYSYFNIDELELRKLGDCCFDLKYPGNDFRMATKQEVLSAYNLVLDVKEEVTNLINKLSIKETSNFE